ncbi:helix-turn-helix transcriptional regulator [uncultured Pseudacidovorax sp.]|uniref:helix-turn-helix domain-containing protein n=1 Tax=uncultured Pseudacidovorax sp. TaxID=679313 RepID=UPI0025FF9B05|nr:helix-turn-helix transcriptional regulator [uncultured Pseudacidovorax sp.]
MPRAKPPPETLRQVFARNVRLVRTNAGMSQEAMAAEAQLDRTFIGSLERGERNISIDNIERLARVVAVPPHELLDPALPKLRGLDETLTRAPRKARIYAAERRPRAKPGA